MSLSETFQHKKSPLQSGLFLSFASLRPDRFPPPLFWRGGQEVRFCLEILLAQLLLQVLVQRFQELLGVEVVAAVLHLVAVDADG